MTHPRPVSRRALLAAAGAAGLVVLGGARQALAHRAHVILTRLSRNPRTARWEFVHTLHQHDAPGCDFTAEAIIKDAKIKTE